MGHKRTAIYIDGYNLYYGRLRGTPFKWLDLSALFDALMSVQDPDSKVESIKLFTAPALGKFASHGNASVEAQQDYHRALQVRDARFSITLGNHSMDRKGSLMPAFVDGQPFDRKNQHRVWRIEEKMTDVNLALAMYRDASKGLFDQLVVCSNDSDAAPALRALREDFPSITIGVVTPVPPPLPAGGPRRISRDLADQANWVRRYLLDDELLAAQLHSVVPTKKKPVRKPAHW